MSLRKLTHFMDRERPHVASQLSECLGAGTGCQWCVPALRTLHEQWTAGRRPELEADPNAWAAGRAEHRRRPRV